MMHKEYPSFILYIFLSMVFLVAFFWFVFDLNQTKSWLVGFATEKKVDNDQITEELAEQKINYKSEFVRGIYLTAASAGSDKFRQNLIERIKRGGRINTVVIDIKDYSGYVLYESQIEKVKQINGFKKVMDARQVVADLHQAGVYVIARQTVFQDPVLASSRTDLALKTFSGTVWYNWGGLAWVDPSNKEVWEYNLAIAQEAAEIGFDEINFDYVRYPSDGNLQTLNFNLESGMSKADVLNSFFEFLSQKLTGTILISADLFGMVMDHPDGSYDLGIGQYLKDALDDFDFVCPMMYPSHYPNNYLGLANPVANPAVVIDFGVSKSADYFLHERAKLRPWLQAFHMGAYYDKNLIDAQTEVVAMATATDGWLLWNAANNYADHIFKN